MVADSPTMVFSSTVLMARNTTLNGPSPSGTSNTALSVRRMARPDGVKATPGSNVAAPPSTSITRPCPIRPGPKMEATSASNVVITVCR